MNRRHADGGFTLIEVLITTVILSIGVTAVLTGMFAATKAAGADRVFADDRAVLLATAEGILAAPYIACAGTAAGGAYAAERAAVEVPATSGADLATRAVIGQIDYWDGVTSYSSSCAYDNAFGAKSRSQRIKLVAGTESLFLVKRAP